MESSEREAILEIVAVLDDVLDVIWRNDPPWEHAAQATTSYLRYTVSVARNRLKELASVP